MVDSWTKLAEANSLAQAGLSILDICMENFLLYQASEVSRKQIAAISDLLAEKGSFQAADGPKIARMLSPLANSLAKFEADSLDNWAPGAAAGPLTQDALRKLAIVAKLCDGFTNIVTDLTREFTMPADPAVKRDMLSLLLPIGRLSQRWTSVLSSASFTLPWSTEVSGLCACITQHVSYNVYTFGECIKGPENAAKQAAEHLRHRMLDDCVLEEISMNTCNFFTKFAHKFDLDTEFDYHFKMMFMGIWSCFQTTPRADFIKWQEELMCCPQYFEAVLQVTEREAARAKALTASCSTNSSTGDAPRTPNNLSRASPLNNDGPGDSEKSLATNPLKGLEDLLRLAFGFYMYPYERESIIGQAVKILSVPEIQQRFLAASTALRDSALAMAGGASQDYIEEAVRSSFIVDVGIALYAFKRSGFYGAVPEETAGYVLPIAMAFGNVSDTLLMVQTLPGVRPNFMTCLLKIFTRIEFNLMAAEEIVCLENFVQTPAAAAELLKEVIYAVKRLASLAAAIPQISDDGNDANGVIMMLSWCLHVVEALRTSGGRLPLQRTLQKYFLPLRPVVKDAIIAVLKVIMIYTSPKMMERVRRAESAAHDKETFGSAAIMVLELFAFCNIIRTTFPDDPLFSFEKREVESVLVLLIRTLDHVAPHMKADNIFRIILCACYISDIFWVVSPCMAGPQPGLEKLAQVLRCYVNSPQSRGDKRLIDALKTHLSSLESMNRRLRAIPESVDQAVACGLAEAGLPCSWVGCTTMLPPGGKKMRSMRCSGCKVAHYCSPACQKKDWKGHKLVCKELAVSKKE